MNFHFGGIKKRGAGGVDTSGPAVPLATRAVLLGFGGGRRLLGVQQIHEALLLSNAGPEMSGDRVFENLFREHYPRLVRTLLRLVGNAGEAEELAADAFYRLHQHRNEDRPDENPAGWLYRTAMNLGLDALRSNSRRSRREERAQVDRAMEDAPANPLYKLLAEEQRERVRNVVSRLKPIQGQVLLMGSSGFTCKEIAGLLGMKSDSLYVLISRARAQFEKEYVSLYGRAE
jgi:RNA polymerase sigma factor (sigma-70 family)